MDKRFHITIKDNQTGTIEVDCDTDCIIGAYHDEQGDSDGSVLCGYTDCNAVTLGKTIFAAMKVGRELSSGPDRMPVMIAHMTEMAGDKEERKNGMDSTGKNERVEIPFPASRKDSKS